MRLPQSFNKKVEGVDVSDILYTRSVVAFGLALLLSSKNLNKRHLYWIATLWVVTTKVRVDDGHCASVHWVSERLALQLLKYVHELFPSLSTSYQYLTASCPSTLRRCIRTYYCQPLVCAAIRRLRHTTYAMRPHDFRLWTTQPDTMTSTSSVSTLKSPRHM